MDILVEPPSPVEDGLGGVQLPYPETDNHDTTKNEHGNDPASRPTVALELGEVEGQEEHEEATADEEETESVNVDEEGVQCSKDWHGLVWMDRNETSSLGPPLVNGEGEDDGEGGNGCADSEEAWAPSPVGVDLAGGDAIDRDCGESGGDFGGDSKIDNVRQTDEADGDTSPLGGDVVCENDLLHDLDTGVADGVDDSTTSNVGSVLRNSDDDKAEDPEEHRDSVCLCATEDVGKLGNGEFANGDEDGLDDGDGGVGRVLVELGGGGGLPCPHGVVVKTSEVGDEGNTKDTDPEGPVGYTTTSFGSNDTNLLFAEVVMGVLGGIPTLGVLDVLGRLRHDCVVGWGGRDRVVQPKGEGKGAGTGWGGQKRGGKLIRSARLNT